jgi:hypothetical protein
MAVINLRKRLFLIGVYGVLPCTLILLLLVGWMVSAEKATVVLQSADSPDGRYRAEVVREDPGVSSSYEYLVRVMPAGLTTLEKSLRMLPFGPVYVALNLHREPDKLTVGWNGPDEVRIQCQGCGEPMPGKEQWRGIKLRYELR